MAISVLDVGEKFSLNALHDSKAVVDIWDGKSIRVLSDSEWISNRDARLMKATQRTHSASGRKVTIAIDDAIFPALYDPKAKLLWDASDRKAWVGAANKELADLLSNAKPAKIGFGAPK